MKIGHGIRKVPGGKLMKIEVKFNDQDSLIYSVKITGDFFCYPNNIITKIEYLFKNKKLAFNTKTGKELEGLKKEMNKIVNHGDLIGISTQDIIEVIVEAISSANIQEETH